MDFIAPRILKEDIETIWKMQVDVDKDQRTKFELNSINKLFSMVVL